MRRIAIFFFYDNQGKVDTYIEYFLKALKQDGIDTLFVVNGKIDEKSQQRIKTYVLDILVRENFGFDVWAYKCGLEYLGYNNICAYDELILLNHTNFGPIFPLSEMFSEMEQRKELDFWGITKSFGNDADIPPHIQSHFTVIRKRMLQDERFAQYWQNCPEISSFQDALYKHEFVFTKYFASLGYKWDVYVNIDEYKGNVSNPLLVYPLDCVCNKRSPIIKRKSFFLEDGWLYETRLGGQLPGLMTYLKNETDYEVGMIWENMLRTQSMATLTKTLSLYHVSAKPQNDKANYKLAIVIDLNDANTFSWIQPYLKKLPENSDIYVYLSNSIQKQKINCILKDSNFCCFLYDKRTSLPAIWQENDKLTEYDAVWFINDERIQSELTDTFRLFDHEHFENVLGSTDSIRECVESFVFDENLGMYVSGVRRHNPGFFKEWRHLFSKYIDFRNKAGIVVPASIDIIPEYYNTDFCIVRGQALPALWNCCIRIEASGFSAELTRCLAVDILQYNGYYTSYWLRSSSAAWAFNFDDFNDRNGMLLNSNETQTATRVEYKGFYYIARKIFGRHGKIANLLRKVKRKLLQKISENERKQDASKGKVSSQLDTIWEQEVFNRLPCDSPDIACLDIAFLVPKPIKGGGGHRNIYRAVKFLSEYGHNVTVYHSDCLNELGTTTKKHVCEWFYPMKDTVKFISYDGLIGHHDVCIACWWELAYELKKNLEKVKFPFYLVQDYEAAFYPTSSSALMAENSYKMGFSHICSGRWCKEFLTSKYQAEAEYFSFPVDHKVYNMNHARTKTNKNIVFFAKPEMPRRCYEIGIRALAIVKEQRPDIEVILFGSNEVNWIPCEVTMKGVLPTIMDLADLYRNADLGMVFSTTNPSLVPYEMMLCGCPVVDVDMEQALMKYGNNPDNVFLFDTQPEIMAKQILDIIDNKDLLHKKAMAGKQWVIDTFPTEEEMGRIVERYILNKVRYGTMIYNIDDEK